MKFGSYDLVCQQLQLAVCMLVGSGDVGVEPKCYARNIEFGGLIVFQAATLIIDLVAIVMTLIMIWHIRTKYTAVGRREMVMVFYLYLAAIILDILTVSGFISFSLGVYPFFVAAYLAMVTALCWCLMLNGFVGFQWAEDGTPTSLWSFRISSLAVFALTYFVSIATFKGWASFSKSNPVVLFSINYVFNLAMLLIYVISQVILVVNTLDEYWPLGNITFAVLFFVAGQAIQYALSISICVAIKHYVDGMFFGSICTLLSMMMIYKYWDSITKEDLEFSVGGKGNVWEVKDLINVDDEFAPYAGKVNSSTYGYTNEYNTASHPSVVAKPHAPHNSEYY